MKRNLTATAIQKAKLITEGKPKKLTDGGGLYLLINQKGKYWRYNFRFNGKFKTLALGVYPETSLKEARMAHDVAHAKVAEGIDPSVQKQIQKVINKDLSENTFEAVGREWFAEFKDTWVESHSKRLIARLENDVFPWLGTRAIHEIEPPEILECMRRVQARGALESAHRVKQVVGQVFRYAVATGRATRDQTADLKGALPSHRKKHFAAIKDKDELAVLLKAIDHYKGTFVVRCALQLSPLVMLRPGELRQAEWKEIDFETSTWTIPISRMKALKATKEENETTHIVPLSHQALKILKDIQPLTGRYQYVFTGARSRTRPLSDNAIRMALRTMGFTNEQMTVHGFRATASTMLNEMGFNPDAIEAQLAHKDSNEIRAAYNRALYLDERREMLQSWADYLDELKKI